MDVFGIIFFLLPAMLLLAWMTWPFFLDSWMRDETSSNAGGLLRWPVKILMPVGFALVTAAGPVGTDQAHRAAARRSALEGRCVAEYERPEQ